jgi:hypothetical protein
MSDRKLLDIEIHMITKARMNNTNEYNYSMIDKREYDKALKKKTAKAFGAS